MLKYLIAFLLPFCACHAGLESRHFMDYVTVKSSKRYVIKECKYIKDGVYVLFYDKDDKRYQGYLCSVSETWVFPKFFSELAIEHSRKLIYEEYSSIFDDPVSESIYGF